MVQYLLVHKTQTHKQFLISIKISADSFVVRDHGVCFEVRFFFDLG